MPVSKNVKMKKKKKRDEKKKKEAKNTNSIDTVFGRNFHFVSRTEGEIYARLVLTRLCLADGSRSLPRRKRSGGDRKIQASE